MKKFGGHIFKGFDTVKNDKKISDTKVKLNKVDERISYFSKKLSPYFTKDKKGKFTPKDQEISHDIEEKITYWKSQVRKYKLKKLAYIDTLESLERKIYIRRDQALDIVRAWIITVPSSAAISAFIFYIFAGVSTVVGSSGYSLF